MKSILLIEDDELLSNLLQTKLTHEGYDVTTAKDGEEGLEALADKIFNLVLLDILMPRMNGMEFLAKLRANKQWEEVPVIVISNSGEPFGDEDAKKFGVVDYLVKANFNPAEVIEKVKQQIGGSEASSTGRIKNPNDKTKTTIPQPEMAGGSTGENPIGNRAIHL